MIMNNRDFRLYVDADISHHSTFELAEKAAQPFMPRKAELRIEILKDIPLDEPDFWAYNYEKGRWEPS